MYILVSTCPSDHETEQDRKLNLILSKVIRDRWIDGWWIDGEMDRWIDG